MKVRGLKGGNAYDGTRIEPGVVVDVSDKVGRTLIDVGLAERAVEPRSRKVSDGSELQGR